MNPEMQRATEYFLRQPYMRKSFIGPFDLGRRVDFQQKVDRTQIQIVSGKPPAGKLYIRNTAWRDPALAIAGYSNETSQKQPELIMFALLPKRDGNFTFIQGGIPITLPQGARMAILFSIKPLPLQDVLTTPEGQILLADSVTDRNRRDFQQVLRDLGKQGYNPSKEVLDIIMAT